VARVERVRGVWCSVRASCAWHHLCGASGGSTWPSSPPAPKAAART